jgi:type I restriction enzyme M protein
LSDEQLWNAIVVAEDLRRLELVELALLEHGPVLSDLHRARAIVRDVHGGARLAGIVELIDRERQSGCGADVFEFLLDKFATGEGRRGAAMHTPPAVVQLVVELAAPSPSASVLDPCCGSGEFLVGAAKYIAVHGGSVASASFTGHALSRRSASLAHMNLRLHDVLADVDERADTIFRSDGSLTADNGFDIVISNPPFDMKGPVWAAPELRGHYGFLPTNRSSFAWLQYVVSSLRDGGRAAVVMPGGALFREGPEQQVRARMVDDGVVEAVVALPPGMFTSTGIPVTVWLLSQSAARRDSLLLIDASDLGHMISRTQRSLSEEVQRRIVDVVMSWRGGGGYKDVQGFSAAVPVQRIGDQDYVLTPARYVGTTISSDTPLKPVRELRDDLIHLGLRAAELDKAADRQLDRIHAWTR